MRRPLSVDRFLARLRRLQRRRRVARQPVAASEPILRAELFSAREMDAHGAVLAGQHALSPHPLPERLLSRLADNEATLIQSCERLTSVTRLGWTITPAAEWLLDNLYLIEEQIRIARQDLPRGYSRALPQLRAGASAGLPRVYDIALETISHGDGRLDATTLEHFIQAYQAVTPLQLGELWAVPIMLRLSLIENLRRVAAKVMADRRGRATAAKWADAMMALAQEDPKNVVLVVADMARSDPEMSSPFVAELARRLQGQGPALAMPLNWIEQRLAETGQSIEHLVQLESQQQAANQVTIANSIGSLRLLATIDWREFVERASLVEAELRRDPGGVYPQMDFATRDHYRHVVERLARGSRASEQEVAQAAIALCQAPTQDGPNVHTHVGYYLVDRGRATLEARLAIKPILATRARRAFDQGPVAIFLGLVVILTAVLLEPTVFLAATAGPATWIVALAGVAALLVASQLALSLTNLVATLAVFPRSLPRMDYALGIPATARTLVAIPSLIATASDLEALVEALEVRFLANRDEHLHFALLTDFTDAPQQTMPGDAALLDLARLRIEALNERYHASSVDRFFLLHRGRTWSPTSQCWMGRERKRGKLGDLNAALRGGSMDAFMLVAGDLAALPRVRYVITLDTDTQLPRESAHVLVGTMDHLLNRPVFDARRGMVVSGHGILQPRVGISLPNIERSRYARLHGSDAGIDPYTRSVSNVYQDLFDEGSFIGKGIYDVDVFEQSLADRLPFERVLSHDLIEGCFARAGLISDVELYEEYPARYADDARRRHRWIRGDWQLLPWLLPWAPTASHGWRVNPLPALARWKILDNLRRSLVPPALLAILLVGWLALVPAATWTAVAIAMTMLPALLSSMLDLLQKQPGVGLRQHLHAATGNIGQHAMQALLAVTMLPHEACYSLGAIGRTLWRMVVSRRRLLEWRASSEVERQGTRDMAQAWRGMAAGPVVAVVVFLLLLLFDRPMALLVAAPFLVAWFVSPAVAQWISLPQRPPSVAPTSRQHAYLRAVARKTWAFFDVHVGAGDHWLPPDNVQLDPSPTVAHRTSPTNMGLALLANLAARDFGYLSSTRLLERCGLTMASMARLQRHRGHFYNWYDTLTLEPLRPLYVSSVDSGNLAGHLLTLRMGLLELIDRPVFDGACLDGLCDTLRLLAAAIDADDERIALLMHSLSSAMPVTSSDVLSLLQVQRDGAQVLVAAYAEPAGGDAAFWSGQFLEQCNDLLDEVRSFHLDPSLGDVHSFVGVATLRALSRVEPLAWPLQSGAEAVRSRAQERIAQIEQLAAQAGDMAVMDFEFLYEGTRRLLSIGYDVEQRRLDASYYDLLASEARLASYVAIAQGQLPQEHWFSMGRLLTTTGGSPVLLSWTGSMFEYLMPMLVMPGFEGTLLDQTCRAAVERQVQYAAQLGRPWGVSESGYNAVDVQLTYQYRAFGVPGLGLKRGLAEDVVMAPYACVLAAMVMPAQAAANLQRLATMGMEARLGFYEAIDFTPSRLPVDQDAAIIKSHMVHHQGMSLLALAQVLLGKPMQRRFSADAQLRATMLLLQERVPRTAAEYLHATGFPELEGTTAAVEPRLRLFTDPDRMRPAVQLLSNGRYHVMVSSAGGGYSRHRDLAVTRWREDITRDHWGMHAYVRDVATGEAWSTAHQPTLKKTERFEVIFSESRAEFRVRQNEVDTHTQIVVSPEDDIELRRVRVTNLGRTRRTIELTSYGEVVLAPPMADLLHPAFSKLFVQTQIVQDLQAILCTRRPRSHDEATPWMCHLLAVHDAHVEEVSYETDRARFIGRGRDASRPRALDADVATLSASEGSVLDPIVAIRCRVTLEPEQSATLDFVTGMADTRAGCLGLIGKYRDRHLADRVFDLAWTHAQVLLRQLNATLAQAQLYEHMATSIIYPNAVLRAEPAVIAGNRRGQSGLWGQAISGDLPIVLLQITEPSRIELARQLVQAHAYWRLKGLAVDLVIWNEDRAGYRQELQDLIMGLITSGSEASLLDRPGGIFVRGSQQLSSEDRQVTMASARIIVNDARGSLAEQIDRHVADTRAPADAAARLARRPALPPSAGPADGHGLAHLQQPNPFGGFSADGREYVVVLDEGMAVPAPWSNVIANASFGTVVSECGSAYTWAENAHELRLTPWDNDPVQDSCGEAMYLRCEDSDHVWSPTPLPRRGEGRYITRHGAGYSVFEHVEQGIASELWTYVATDAAVKFLVLKLENQSGRTRRLSATGYVEWVLGDVREKTAMQVVTSTDPGSGAIFARNAYNLEFPGRVAFFDVEDPSRRVGGDRTDFLGRNGSTAAPAALARPAWSSRVGAALDPCAAIGLDIVLEAGEKRDVVFRLGLGRDEADATALVHRFRRNGTAADELGRVHAQWDALLGAVQVATPERGIDLLANRWLMYQTIACRFWARSGYYQSGGAIGYRDQLQDAMAMLHAAPHLLRDQLLLCAAHQFPEGDVQHWWHPPLDRGVRTQCSDDFLWLPLATARYVLATGDTAVLDVPVAYIEGRPLQPGEESYYDLPQPSSLREPLYRHCVRAIEHGLARGAHGLPLIGSGDWNDGMNRVGEKGRGESVWLGFFGCHVMREFARVARQRGDGAFADACEGHIGQLGEALESQAWDGAWYRRAWFDDGTPLGASTNEECRIDSIAQSWSVLSGMAPPDRARQALQSLDQHLVRPEAGLIQLLDPPFDRTPMDPGYIRGYVPGVRENGGQYTHAAIWAVMAFAESGDAERAWELLRMIQPGSHVGDASATDTYKVEPYVVTADIYAVAPHVGRGGWSWYTGSAGWMYRLVIESLLGLRLEGGALTFRPVVPAAWEGYQVTYRHGGSVHDITFRKARAGEDASVTVDGVAIADGRLTLDDAPATRQVQVVYPALDAPWTPR